MTATLIARQCKREHKLDSEQDQAMILLFDNSINYSLWKQRFVEIRPRGHVWYINIPTWLWGFQVKIEIFFSCFYLRIPRRDLIIKQKTTPKYRSLSWKPRSHVRILIYRTWPIQEKKINCIHAGLLYWLLLLIIVTLWKLQRLVQLLTNCLWIMKSIKQFTRRRLQAFAEEDWE